MPLPSNGTLSLQGYSKPGENETITAPPKQAMIVRMSAETLDALEGVPQPQMEVSFVENSVGIYIGETFYPMRPSGEFSPHELYLRSSSAAKPMAPLKHYATVTGKFNVERILDSNITDKIRHHTQVLEKQRNERKIQVLDAPPMLDNAKMNGKKRKAPATTSASTSLLKRAAHNDHLRNVSAQSSSRVSSPLPPRPSSPATPSPSTSTPKDSSARKRMVRYLAVSNRLPEEVVRAIGGPDADASTKQNLRVLLDEIAEPDGPLKKGDKSPRQYALKKRLWLEVRPYEWKLTEPERTRMLRAARVVFGDLKIPESDAVWDNVRHRAGPSKVNSPNASPAARSGSAPSSSLSSVKPEPKRGITSTEVKEKKAKARSSDVPKTKNTPADVQMKDESKAARVSSGLVKKESVESKSASLPPGAGKRASSSATKVPKTEASATPTPTRPSEAPLKKPSTSRQSTTPTHTSAQPVPEKKPATMRISKKPMPTAGADSERDSPSGSTGLKRKKPDEEEPVKKVNPSTTLPKKRKTEEVATPPIKSEPKRDLSLPKKPSTDLSSTATRPKPTASPLPPPPSARSKEPPSRLVSSSSTPSSKPRTVSDKDHERGSSTKPNGSLKSRREITYTSSENDDEGEIPQHTPGSSVAGGNGGNGSGGRLPAFVYKTRPPLPSPSDHTALRKRYSASYQEYIQLFTMMVQQKGAIEKMLKSGSDEGGVELLESKELAKLASEHQSLKCELEDIKHAFLTGKTLAEMSD